MSSAGRSSKTPSAEVDEEVEHHFESDLGDMDLVAAAAQGAELELRHPATGAGLRIYVTVCGRDSETYEKALRRVTDQAQRDGAKTVATSVYQRRAAEMGAAIILGWSYDKKVSSSPTDDKYERVQGMIPWHKNELPFSEENAVNVLLQRSWIREQVEAFANVRANFFTG